MDTTEEATAIISNACLQHPNGILVCGDLNLPSINRYPNTTPTVTPNTATSRPARHLLETLDTLDLNQWIEQPTFHNIEQDLQGRTNKTVRPYFYKYFFEYVSLRTNVINIGYSYLDLSFKSV